MLCLRCLCISLCSLFIVVIVTVCLITVYSLSCFNCLLVDIVRRDISNNVRFHVNTLLFSDKSVLFSALSIRPLTSIIVKHAYFASTKLSRLEGFATLNTGKFLELPITISLTSVM